MRLILFLVSVLLTAATASATDPKELEKPLADQLNGKTWILRGFPKDDKLTFDSALHLMQSAHSGDWTNSQIRVDEVLAEGDSLLITGKHTNAGDERSPFVIGSKNVTITIRGPFTKSTVDSVNAIRDQLFLGPEEIASALHDPGPWIAFFSGMIVPDRDKPGSYTLTLPRSNDPAAASESAIFSGWQHGENVYRAKGDVKPPKPTYMPDPEYSEAARKAKLQGTVVLVAIVDKNGDVFRTFFAKPAGAGFDDKALAALQQWKFQPASKNGLPVACVISVEMSFRLY